MSDAAGRGTSDRGAIGASDRGAILASLEGFPVRLAAAATAVLDRPVRAGDWTPGHVIRHLIACETDVHQARLSDLAMVDSPTWGWAEPGPWPGEPDLSLDDLLVRFASLRATTLATVEALDVAGWTRSGTHTTLGAFDVRALLANAVEHDEHHLTGLVLD